MSARRGTARVNAEIQRPSGRAAPVTVRGVMVDTGAEMTWIGTEMLRDAGVAVRKKDQAVIMANGQRITRDAGWIVTFEPGVFHDYEMRSASMLTYELHRDNVLAYTGDFWSPSVELLVARVRYPSARTRPSRRAGTTGRFLSRRIHAVRRRLVSPRRAG